MEREFMEFDVVVVGAGPAGLSAAIRLMQQAKAHDQTMSVCVIDKGSEVGAHILSGAIIEPTALNELFPDWQTRKAPLNTPVTKDEVYLFTSECGGIKMPNFVVPKTMHNQGNYIASLGNFCRWLAEQAEELGVEIFPGFAASEVIYDENGCVKGVITGDMGISEAGEHKDSYMPGMELRAKYTLFAEGCRGSLGKSLQQRFDLAVLADAQHYGLGMKELWDVDPANHKEGLVVHGSGWPLVKDSSGGFFLYHTENNQVVVGLIVDLNYRNPHMSPFDEFQRLKHHPKIAEVLKGGKRVSYGARAITKGGLNALPKMTFAGGMIIGCNAGTLNFAKIKGSHTAMKSGMLAAESVFEALNNEAHKEGAELVDFAERMKSSWLYDELYQSRSFGPALHKFGLLMGGGFNFLDQNIFSGKLPFTIRDNHDDHKQLKQAKACDIIHYPKPDGVLSFDKLSSVFISNTNHEEDQPCHLTLIDSRIPIDVNLVQFDEPAQRYCPAGVYEIVESAGQKHLQINSQNCLHCKTCDIKDPMQNITWRVPEGAGGPNYPNM